VGVEILNGVERRRRWSEDEKDEGNRLAGLDRQLTEYFSVVTAPTGGIVAVATTSIPERLGGVRNWDYRYCWLRDATFTFLALMHLGYYDEARAWRDWLVRAAAGSPSQVQIVYGLGGERWLPEVIIPWLPGYENSCGLETRRTSSCSSTSSARLPTRRFRRSRQAWSRPNAAKPCGRSYWNIWRLPWRQPDEGVWVTRGGAAALRSLEGHGLGRVRSRGERNES